MIAFRQPAFAPVSLGRRILSQQVVPATPLQPPTPGQLKGMGSLVGAVMLAFSGATAWVGINTGLKEKGALKYAGWLVGAGGALSSLVEFYGIIKLLATPSGDLQQMIQKNQRPTTSEI